MRFSILSVLFLWALIFSFSSCEDLSYSSEPPIEASLNGEFVTKSMGIDSTQSDPWDTMGEKYGVDSVTLYPKK